MTLASSRRVLSLCRGDEGIRSEMRHVTPLRAPRPGFGLREPAAGETLAPGATPSPPLPTVPHTRPPTVLPPTPLCGRDACAGRDPNGRGERDGVGAGLCLQRGRGVSG
jgi:hypothetical protein